MKKIMLLAACAAMLASCSNDDELIQPAQSLEDTPIQVNVAVEDLQTRAGYDDANLPGQFYLKVVHPDKSKYSYDVQMKYEEGSWNSYLTDGTTSAQMLWAGDDKQIYVTAATFPLQEDANVSLGIETDQSTEEKVKASDHLLMIPTAVTPSKSGINVTLNHLMAKVKLIIELKDELVFEENPFAKVSVDGTLPKRNCNLGSFGAISDKSLTWSEAYDGNNAVTPKSITPLQNSYTKAEGTNRAKGEFEVILLPNTYEAGKFMVSFKVGDRTFRWTSAEEITLESGTEYTLKLTAGHDYINSASFFSSAWETGETITGKETE